MADFVALRDSAGDIKVDSTGKLMLGHNTARPCPRCCSSASSEAVGGALYCDCWPCTLTVSFTGLSYANHCPGPSGSVEGVPWEQPGWKVIGSLDGTYTCRRIDDCRYEWSAPEGTTEPRYQLYEDNDCTIEATSPPAFQDPYNQPLASVSVTFEDGRMFVSATAAAHAQDTEAIPPQNIYLLFFAGIGIASCATTQTVYNDLQFDGDVTGWADVRNKGIAWGGHATVTRGGGDCTNSRSGQAGRDDGELLWYSSGPMTAGGYNITYVGGALNWYEDETSGVSDPPQYQINNGSAKYVIVKESIPGGIPSGVITTIMDAPGSTTPYDSQRACEDAEGTPSASFSIGTNYRIGVKCVDPTGHTHGVDGINGQAPNFCLCMPENPCDENCEITCWDVTADGYIFLPAGQYTIYYKSGARRFDEDPNDESQSGFRPLSSADTRSDQSASSDSVGEDHCYRANHWDDGRGFEVVAVKGIYCPSIEAIDCPPSIFTVIDRAPGLDQCYDTLADAEAANAGQSVVVDMPFNGHLGVRLHDTGFTGAGTVTYTICIGTVSPPHDSSSTDDRTSSSQSLSSSSSSSSSSGDCIWCQWTAHYNTDSPVGWHIVNHTCVQHVGNPFSTPEGVWTLDPAFLPSCVMKYVNKNCLESSEASVPDVPTETPPECCCDACDQISVGDSSLSSRCKILSCIDVDIGGGSSGSFSDICGNSYTWVETAFSGGPTVCDCVGVGTTCNYVTITRVS